MIWTFWFSVWIVEWDCTIRMIPVSRDTIIFPSSRTVLPCISLSVIRSKANCGFGTDNNEELRLISKLKVEVSAIEAEFCTIMEKNGLKSSFF